MSLLSAKETEHQKSASRLKALLSKLVFFKTLTCCCVSRVCILLSKLSHKTKAKQARPSKYVISLYFNVCRNTSVIHLWQMCFIYSYFLLGISDVHVGERAIICWICQKPRCFEDIFCMIGVSNALLHKGNVVSAYAFASYQSTNKPLSHLCQR